MLLLLSRRGKLKRSRCEMWCWPPLLLMSTITINCLAELAVGALFFLLSLGLLLHALLVMLNFIRELFLRYLAIKILSLRHFKLLFFSPV